MTAALVAAHLIVGVTALVGVALVWRAHLKLVGMTRDLAVNTQEVVEDLLERVEELERRLPLNDRLGRLRLPDVEALS